MTQQPVNHVREMQRKGARRTIWIATSIAVVLFVLSIAQMIKM
jgi:hypothetical protein